MIDRRRYAICRWPCRWRACRQCPSTRAGCGCLPERIAVSDCDDLKPAMGLPSRRVSRTRSLHRTTVVEAILIVLDDSRDGVKRIAGIRILSGVLQIKILDRDVVVAELEIAANRFEVRFLHFLTHAFFIAEIAFD